MPPPVVLARWDSHETVWDGPAVLAAPIVSDIAQYASVRTALLWRGDLTPSPPAPVTSPFDQWPTTSTQEPQP